MACNKSSCEYGSYVKALITHPWNETSDDLAKMREIENWRKNHVFEEIPFVGQPSVSTHWVLIEKSIDGKKIVKDRLVARGYEEQQLWQTDCPTYKKECLRLIWSIFASKGWQSNSIDIKSAFSQRKAIQRDASIVSS